MSIKSFHEEDQPREKFLLKGKAALSDAELLAIILGSGSREETVVELARTILKSVDYNWYALSRLSIQDLKKFKGVGEAKAISIAAALEIGRRKAAQDVPEQKKISGSNDAFRFLHPFLGDLVTEEFWVMFLNQSNKVVYKMPLTQGGITQSVVDLRVLFKNALDHYATSIIVAHNHPSGNLKPSEQDKSITQQIKNAGQLLSIQLLDHLIITNKSYLSFADEGLL